MTIEGGRAAEVLAHVEKRRSPAATRVCSEARDYAFSEYRQKGKGSSVRHSN